MYCMCMAVPCSAWSAEVAVGTVDVLRQTELVHAVAYLRAISFNVLPEERAWNAPVYHRLKADKEVERLVENKEGKDRMYSRSICLLHIHLVSCSCSIY